MLISGKNISLVTEDGGVRDIESLCVGNTVCTYNGVAEILAVQKNIGLVYSVHVFNCVFFVSEFQPITLFYQKDGAFGKKYEIIRLHPRDIPHDALFMSIAQIPCVFPSSYLMLKNMSCIGRWLVTREDKLPKLLQSFKKSVRREFLGVLETHRLNMFRKEFPASLHNSSMQTRQSIIRGILKVVKPTIEKCGSSVSPIRNYSMVIPMCDKYVQAHILRVLLSIGHNAETYLDSSIRVFAETCSQLKQLLSARPKFYKTLHPMRIGIATKDEYTTLTVKGDDFPPVYINNYLAI